VRSEAMAAHHLPSFINRKMPTWSCGDRFGPSIFGRFI
jgi:hypothetical protein